MEGKGGRVTGCGGWRVESGQLTLKTFFFFPPARPPFFFSFTSGIFHVSLRSVKVKSDRKGRHEAKAPGQIRTQAAAGEASAYMGPSLIR